MELFQLRIWRPHRRMHRGRSARATAFPRSPTFNPSCSRTPSSQSRPRVSAVLQAPTRPVVDTALTTRLSRLAGQLALNDHGSQIGSPRVAVPESNRSRAWQAADVSSGTAPSGTSTPTSNTPLPTTDTTAPGTASLTSSGGYSEALGSGYTASGSLELGSVQHAAPNLRVGNVVLGAACTVNNETDAVVPWTLTITNTTASFSLTGLGATALLVGPDGTSGISGGSYEYVVNGQPQCADQTTSDNGAPGAPLGKSTVLNLSRA